MKFVSISDVHIKKPNDKAHELFLEFLNSEETRKSDYIFLLGDIFDLLVGPGYEFEKRYVKILNKIRELLNLGKKIIHYEGNHDFHFQVLLKSLLEKWDLDKSVWIYKTSPEIFNLNDKKILFCHGDEIEIGNFSYKFYRLWIRSFIIKFFAHYVVPGKWIQRIGDNASSKSRKRNHSKYNSEIMEKRVKPSFRKFALRAAIKYGAEVVICGHSHYQDDYRGEIHYLNNGYFPELMTFIYGDEDKIELKVLNN